MSDPKPKPTRRQMNVRLPPELVDRIDARRATRGLSRDAWIERALTYALDSQTRPKPLQTGNGRTAPPPHRRRPTP